MRVTACHVATDVRYRSIEVAGSSATQDDILYLRLSRFAPLSSVAELLYNELPETVRRRATHVVVQAHPALWGELEADQYLVDDLCGRLGVSEVDVIRIEPVTSSHAVETLYATGTAESRRAALTRDEVASVAREVDFRDMVSRAGAALPATAQFHYEGPNGSHYTSFLRPGFSFASMEDLDAICFWLAPLVPTDAVIVVDTWNLAALALALLSYASLVDPNGPPPLACVETYGEDATVVAAHVRGIAAATQRRSIFLIVSVSGTGRFATEMLAALQERTRLPVQAVVLFATDRSVLPPSAVVLQDAPGVRRYPAAECEMCLSEEAKSPVIRILSRSYLLELSGAVVQARITSQSAESARAFFADVHDAGGISVHRDQHDGARHHAIYVDVARLLKAPAFQRRCREMASRIAAAEPDVIVTPDHEAGKTLATFLASELRVPAFTVAEDDIAARLADERYSALQSADRILLVDDVSITGHRLMGYHTGFRDAGLIAHANGVELLYAVGVFRPPSDAAKSGIREMISRRHFYFAAEFLLPDWADEPDCPWCQEESLLEAHPALVERHPALRARLDFLAAKAAGLSENLFLRWRPGGQWPSNPASEEEWRERSRWLQSEEPRAKIDLSYDLGPHSVFGHAGEADLFAIVSSATQTLRSGGELHSDDYQQPLAKVLDPYLYLRGRYYDPIIIAAILRAVRRHDLRATAVEKLLRRAVAEKLQHGGYREVRSELMLAIAQGKLPRPYELRTNRSLFTAGEEGLVAWLQAMTLPGGPQR